MYFKSDGVTLRHCSRTVFLHMQEKLTGKTKVDSKIRTLFLYYNWRKKALRVQKNLLRFALNGNSRTTKAMVCSIVD